MRPTRAELVRRLEPALVVAAVAVVLLAHGVAPDEAAPRRHLAGACLTITSLALWAAARYQLGASFTTRAEARRLVTRGLYARIRNPIYVFGELTSVGLFVYLGWWWLLPVSIVTIPVQVRRARREARALEEAFGDEYRAYRARRWF